MMGAVDPHGTTGQGTSRCNLIITLLRNLVPKANKPKQANRPKQLRKRTEQNQLFQNTINTPIPTLFYRQYMPPGPGERLEGSRALSGDYNLREAQT
jgi:hypothetical protein